MSRHWDARVSGCYLPSRPSCATLDQAAVFPLVLATQEREVQLCNGDALDLVARRFCGLCVSVGQRMQEMPAARVGVTLEDEDAFAHAGDSARRQSVA